MINKETILSVYDDKLTLLEWVSKVENALNNGVLSSASLVDEGNNDYHFVFVFEDESEIITPSFTMPKQITSAYISSGNLHIVLIDGTDINVGSIGASFGNVTINGTLSVTGSLTVGQNPIYGGDTITARGNIKSEEGYIETDEFVRPSTSASQLDISTAKGTMTPTTVPDGLTCDFAFARVSNGKLSVGIQISNEANTTITEGSFTVSFSIPSAVGENLYPNSDGYLSRARIYLCGPYGTRSNLIIVGVYKNSNTTIGINVYVGALSSGASGVATARWEQNFVL